MADSMVVRSADSMVAYLVAATAESKDTLRVDDWDGSLVAQKVAKMAGWRVAW